MTTKIGLPENRKRLKGAGIQYAKNAAFDEGYNAGFDAGVKYYREQTANFIHQLGINSKHYDGLNALVYAYQAINVIMGNQTWEYYIERERQEYEEKKKTK